MSPAPKRRATNRCEVCAWRTVKQFEGEYEIEAYKCKNRTSPHYGRIVYAIEACHQFERELEAAE